MSSGVSITNFDVDAVQAQLDNLKNIGDDIGTILDLLNPDKSERLIPEDFYEINASLSNSNVSMAPLTNEARNQMVIDIAQSSDKVVDIDTNFGNDALSIIEKIQKARNDISLADASGLYTSTFNGEQQGATGSGAVNGQGANAILNNGEQQGATGSGAVNGQGANATLNNGEQAGATGNNGTNAYKASGVLAAAAGVAVSSAAVSSQSNNASTSDENKDAVGDASDVNASNQNGTLSNTSKETNSHTGVVAASAFAGAIEASSNNNRDSSSVNSSDNNYDLSNNIVLKDANGNQININSGTYKIVEQKYDEKGNVTAICIEKDGKRIWLYLDENGNIREVSLVGVNNQTYTLTEDLLFTLSNGEVINLAKGNYQIQEYIYDSYGNIIGIAIINEGRRIVIQIKDGKAVGILDAHSKSYTINKDIYVYDKEGNIVCVKEGTYNIDHYIYDIDGNIIAIVCIVDNKLITIRVFDGKIVDGINSINKDYILNNPITIILSDGTSLVLEQGTYKIIDALYDKYGNVIALCIEKKEYKIWLYLDENGNIQNIRYTSINNGIYIINKTTYVRDKYGNLLAIIDSGNYYIYEVMYDENGNIIGIRISKNGDDEKWIFFNENQDAGSYSLFSETINNGNSTISLFQKNGLLLGILGLLIIGLGALYKVKKKKKNSDDIIQGYIKEEYVDDIKPGNYAIYDYQKDEAGKIKEIRISPNDSEDEYWVEM